MLRIICILLCLCALSALSACGGGGSDDPASDAAALIERQRVIYSQRPNVTHTLVREWDQNARDILFLQDKPACTADACILEWQVLTHPWIWEIAL